MKRTGIQAFAVVLFATWNAWTALAVGAERQLISAADFGALPFMVEPKMSPDAKHVVTTAHINGTKRLVSYATVDGFPLIASLGRTETEIFRSARADALIYWLIALLVTGCIAVAIAYGARRQRKLDEAAASLERTNARFSLALENMPHGLCMYDSKQRLVIANRRYAEIYRLPTDAIVPTA